MDLGRICLSCGSEKAGRLAVGTQSHLLEDVSMAGSSCLRRRTWSSEEMRMEMVGVIQRAGKVKEHSQLSLQGKQRKGKRTIAETPLSFTSNIY